MDIFKQIIDQRISKIMTDNPDFYKEDDDNRRKSKAFLLLGVASFLDIDIAEAIQYITDGRADGILGRNAINEQSAAEIDELKRKLKEYEEKYK